MNKETLRNLATGAAWRALRDELFIPTLEEAKDVTKDLDIDMKVTPEQMYLGKIIAVKYLKRIITRMESLRSRPRSEKDSMI